mgnify:CR=1 FL=1
MIKGSQYQYVPNDKRQKHIILQYRKIGKLNQSRNCHHSNAFSHSKRLKEQVSAYASAKYAITRSVVKHKWIEKCETRHSFKL